MSEQTPRRRRTREYYSPEEFIPYPAADSFDAMPPDIPFDMPPDTPSAPPKRKFRLPPLGESLRRTMQLLRSARPDFPFRRPHGVGDLLNMLQDVLLCDGMGTGGGGKADAEEAISLLRAMITAGFIGFGMGATSNAMANMQAVSRRYGPSPSAYFVIPMVGGLFNDFFNAAIIAFCIGLLA